jgi:hypothetical protein
MGLLGDAGVTPSVDLDVAEGPILPGLPGHDPAAPSPDDLHALEREANRLSRTWYRYAALERAAGCHGVSLLEALEYHFVGDLLAALGDTAFPSVAAARGARRGP